MVQIDKLLVVRLGAMGDIIHTLPAVARLRQSFPKANISWMVESKWMPLLKGNPCLDEVIPVPLSQWRADSLSLSTWKSLRELFHQLRKSRFDVAVDFQGLLKSSTITYCSGSNRIFGFDHRAVKERISALFYSDPVKSCSEHVVDKNLDLVVALGARSGSIVFPIPPGDISPLLPTGKFVLAAPVAGWVSKQWPAEYYSELARLMWVHRGIPLVLDCAPRNNSYIERIRDGAPNHSCIMHNSSLAQLIAATRRARAVIGVDSGPLHLAAALGVPGVALYGPTDPARNGPYGTSFRVLRDAKVLTSYKRGKRIHSSMLRISPERVWELLASVLDATDM